MKRLLVLCVLLGVSYPSFSQKTVISPDKMNVLYIGVPNPVTIMAEGYPCGQTVLEAEGCTITPRDNCSYDILVRSPGTVSVRIKAKNDTSKVIGEHIFRAKYIPDPIARVGGCRCNGRMLTSVFKAQLGVVAATPNFDFDMRFRVVSYRLSVIRKKNILFDEDNKGANFTTMSKMALDNVKPGDRIMVTDIKAVGPDSRTRTLQSIEFDLF